MQREFGQDLPIALARIDTDASDRTLRWAAAGIGSERVIACSTSFDVGLPIWIMPLRAQRSPPMALCIRGDDPRTPPHDVAGYCRGAWECGAGAQAEPAACRASNREAVHALRNALNTVTMASAVLGRTSLPPAAAPFVVDLQAAVQRSLVALSRMSDAPGDLGTDDAALQPPAHDSVHESISVQTNGAACRRTG